eukprot:Rhum_TRINITY_DN13457_c1_g1::Rhum_TRINITY_DN13457_c1_g1_i1::g.60640::m.60640
MFFFCKLYLCRNLRAACGAVLLAATTLPVGASRRVLGPTVLAAADTRLEAVHVDELACLSLRARALVEIRTLPLSERPRLPFNRAQPAAQRNLVLLRTQVVPLVVLARRRVVCVPGLAAQRRGAVAVAVVVAGLVRLRHGRQKLQLVRRLRLLAAFIQRHGNRTPTDQEADSLHVSGRAQIQGRQAIRVKKVDVSTSINECSHDTCVRFRTGEVQRASVDPTANLDVRSTENKEVHQIHDARANGAQKRCLCCEVPSCDVLVAVEAGRHVRCAEGEITTQCGFAEAREGGLACTALKGHQRQETVARRDDNVVSGNDRVGRRIVQNCVETAEVEVARVVVRVGHEAGRQRAHECHLQVQKSSGHVRVRQADGAASRRVHGIACAHTE